MTPKWRMAPDRYLDPDPVQKSKALEFYRVIKDLPYICPHGHVDPSLFVDSDATFGTPTELLIIPDHYVFRMLYSQGIPLSALGVPRGTGEQDHRKIWQTFADHFYLFRGTPTGIWMAYMFNEVLGVDTKLTGETAQAIYDQVEAKLAMPEFRPRALFEQFNIEVLCISERG